MPIDFIKKPTGGGFPFINVGGHPLAEAVAAIGRFASLLRADEIRFHSSRPEFKEGDRFDFLIVTQTDLSSPDTATLFRDGDIVGNIVGLPLTKQIVDDWQEKKK